MLNLNLIKSTRHFLQRIVGHHWPLAASSLLFILALVVLWLTGLAKPYIDKDFLYSANIQTVQNSYDAANSRYGNDNYVLSTYSLTRISPNDSDNIATVRSTIRIGSTTAQGQGVLPTINKDYRVNGGSGRIVSTGTDTQTKTQSETYLFGPRNLAKSQSFITLHPSYSIPATMEFQDQESVDGLPIYHYSSNFSTDGLVESIDPTAASGKRIFKPKIDMWIEPTTGWLINYQEKTTEYAYPTTATPLPVQRISTTMSEESVRQNASYAKSLKTSLDFGRQVVPSLLIISFLIPCAFGLVYLLKARIIRAEIIATIILTASMANIAGWLLHITPLTTLGLGSIPLNPTASACFILLALGMLLLRQPRFCKVSAGLGLAIIILAFASAIDPEDTVTIAINDTTVNAGKLSLFGVLSFIILGSGLVKAALAKYHTAVEIAKLLAGMAITLGCTGLLAKILLLDQVFIVPPVASLSLSGSILCILSGLGLLQILLRHASRNEPAGLSSRSLLQSLIRPVIITVPLILIGVVAQFQQISIHQKLQEVFSDQTSNLQATITARATTYINTLDGAKALYDSSVNVERSEWHDYIRSLNLTQSYPGMRGVGLVPVFAAQEARQTIQRIQQTDYPSFALYPAGNRPSYSPILYFEPTDTGSDKLIGYDMSTDSVRSAAMQLATKSNTTTISSKIAALQEAGVDTVSGFVAFAPIYHKAWPTDTVEQRQRALEGYVYAPFYGAEFFKNAVGDQNANLVIEVYDGIQATSSNLLYANRAADSSTTPTFTKTSVIYVGNHPWTIKYSADPTTEPSWNGEATPTYIIVGAGSFYLLSLGCIYIFGTVLRRRSNQPRARS